VVLRHAQSLERNPERNPSLHDTPFLVQVSGSAMQSQHLLGIAFPAVRDLSLQLSLAAGRQGRMVQGLRVCSQLTTLTLTDCNILNPEVPEAAAALASLPSLKEIHLNGDNLPRALVAELTGLTSLSLPLMRSEVRAGVLLSGVTSLSGFPTSPFTCAGWPHCIIPLLQPCAYCVLIPKFPQLLQCGQHRADHLSLY
jgi:hypothetical protein